MSLFPNEDVLTKEEIESWRSFVDSLSSSEDRELFETLLNDCYNYPAAISAMGEPSFSRSITYDLAAFITYKMIGWLTKQILKHESHDNNNKEVKHSKEEEQNLDRENTNDYIRSNERIHYIDDY